MLPRLSDRSIFYNLRSLALAGFGALNHNRAVAIQRLEPRAGVPVLRFDRPKTHLSGLRDV